MAETFIPPLFGGRTGHEEIVTVVRQQFFHTTKK
jgi:hypothetical protein